MKNSYFKNIVKILAITTLSTGIACADEYCNGYDEGYKSGYREAVGVPGMDVSVPICSPQPIGLYDQAERDQKDGYKQGYREGYEKGKEQK